MSVEETTTETVSTIDPDGPRYGMSASYMSCRHCAEGSIVYDPEIEDSRCRACGAVDQ
jgi:ribosomal protein S27E